MSVVPFRVKAPVLLDIDSLPKSGSWEYRFGSSSIVSRRNRTCNILISASLFCHNYVSCLVFVTDIAGEKKRHVIESARIVNDEGRMYSAFCAEFSIENIVLNTGESVSFSVEATPTLLYDDISRMVPSQLSPRFEVTICE